jgi:hypothetical protein
MTLTAPVRHLPAGRRKHVKRISILRLDKGAIPMNVQFARTRDAISHPPFRARPRSEGGHVSLALQSLSFARGDGGGREPSRCVIAVHDFVAPGPPHVRTFIAAEHPSQLR